MWVLRGLRKKLPVRVREEEGEGLVGQCVTVGTWLNRYVSGRGS